MINAEKTGAYIQTLRKEKGMTQTELGERLGLSCQAISKWERGEGLPDTSVLLDLAEILETTVDSLLRGGEVHIPFSGKLSVENILEGIQSFFTLPRLIGRDNTLYQGMIEGINRRMNLDWDEDLAGREERWCVELFAAEVIIQEIGHGKWVDLAEVDRLFALEKWRNNIHRYAHAAGIR